MIDNYFKGIVMLAGSGIKTPSSGCPTWSKSTAQSYGNELNKRGRSKKGSLQGYLQNPKRQEMANRINRQCELKPL